MKIFRSKLLSKFSEIHHGTSTKLFGSLSFKYSPDSNEVIIDRAIFLKALGLPLNHSVFVCEQKHTDNVVLVFEKDEGKGAFDEVSRIPNADAMITNKKQVNLILYTADCVPILIFDPKTKAIAAAHSGWKGTVKKIAIKTIKKMEKEFGSKKENLKIYLGPSIGPCCYAVKNKEQIQEFKKYKNGIIKKNGKIYVDLWSSIEQDLEEYGINSKNIDNPKVCTVCKNNLFASHYLEGKKRTTTNLSVISMI